MWNESLRRILPNRLTGDEPLHSGGNPIRSEEDRSEFLAVVSIGFNRQYAAGRSRGISRRARRRGGGRHARVGMDFLRH